MTTSPVTNRQINAQPMRSFELPNRSMKGSKRSFESTADQPQRAANTRARCAFTSAMRSGSTATNTVSSPARVPI